MMIYKSIEWKQKYPTINTKNQLKSKEIQIYKIYEQIIRDTRTKNLKLVNKKNLKNKNLQIINKENLKKPRSNLVIILEKLSSIQNLNKKILQDSK